MAQAALPPELDGTDIDGAALHWFALLRDDAASAADRQACARWRAQDPAHEAAWRELEQLWGALDKVPLPARLTSPPRQGRRRTWGPRAAALAATLALAIGLGATLAPKGLLADHRTATGQRQIVTLADGSVMELAGGSAADIHFTPAQRQVTLLAGEAFFTVAPMQDRPFIVTAGPGSVTVRGTAFDVKLGERVTVAVTHNRVDVAAGGSAPVAVAAGQSVQYDDAGVSAPAAADPAIVQAWREDKLVFQDVPLRQVLADLGRYHPGYIRLLEDGLGDRRVTAVFDAGRTDAALETLAAGLGLRLYRLSGLLVAIGPE